MVERSLSMREVLGSMPRYSSARLRPAISAAWHSARAPTLSVSTRVLSWLPCHRSRTVCSPGPHRGFGLAFTSSLHPPLGTLRWRRRGGRARLFLSLAPHSRASLTIPGGRSGDQIHNCMHRLVDYFTLCPREALKLVPPPPSPPPRWQLASLPTPTCLTSRLPSCPHTPLLVRCCGQYGRRGRGAQCASVAGVAVVASVAGSSLAGALGGFGRNLPLGASSARDPCGRQKCASGEADLNHRPKDTC